MLKMPCPSPHQKFTAILLLLGTISIWLAIQFIGSEWSFTTGDFLSVALLIWLYTGSNVARWITGILCSIATLIAWGGGFYFYVYRDAQQYMQGVEYLSILFWLVAAIIYPVVTYRLLFRRKPSDMGIALA